VLAWDPDNLEALQLRGVAAAAAAAMIDKPAAMMADLGWADVVAPDDAQTLAFSGMANLDGGNLADLDRTDAILLIKRGGPGAAQKLPGPLLLAAIRMRILSAREATNLGLGRLEEALLDLKGADAAQPDQVTIPYIRGRVQLGLVRLEEALSHLDRAAALQDLSAVEGAGILHLPASSWKLARRSTGSWASGRTRCRIWSVPSS
jgi:hypothetical protein